MFLVLKKFIKFETHRRLAPWTEVSNTISDIVKECKIGKAKCSTLKKAFLNLPWDVIEALHPVTIAGCWADIGMWPFNFFVMVNNCPGWAELSYEQMRTIYLNLPWLCLVMYLTGRIEESDLTEAGCPPDDSGIER